jgi:hypothetical protein
MAYHVGQRTQEIGLRMTSLGGTIRMLTGRRKMPDRSKEGRQTGAPLAS